MYNADVKNVYTTIIMCPYMHSYSLLFLGLIIVTIKLSPKTDAIFYQDPQQHKHHLIPVSEHCKWVNDYKPNKL